MMRNPLVQTTLSHLQRQPPPPPRRLAQPAAQLDERLDEATAAAAGTRASLQRTIIASLQQLPIHDVSWPQMTSRRRDVMLR